jgi:hypothetical protein
MTITGGPHQRDAWQTFLSHFFSTLSSPARSLPLRSSFDEATINSPVEQQNET